MDITTAAREAAETPYDEADRAPFKDAVRRLLRAYGGKFPDAEGGAWERFRTSADPTELDRFQAWLHGTTNPTSPEDDDDDERDDAQVGDPE